MARSKFGWLGQQQTTGDHKNNCLGRVPWSSILKRNNAEPGKGWNFFECTCRTPVFVNAIRWCILLKAVHSH